MQIPMPEFFTADVAAYKCEFEITNLDEYLADTPEDAAYYEIRGVVVDDTVAGARCSKEWYLYLYEDGKCPEPDHAICPEPTAPIYGGLAYPIDEHSSCVGPFQDSYAECEDAIQYIMGELLENKYGDQAHYVRKGVYPERCIIQSYISQCEQHGSSQCPLPSPSVDFVTFEEEQNVIAISNEISQIANVTLQSCTDGCEADVECVSFDYNGSTCHMYSYLESEQTKRALWNHHVKTYLTSDLPATAFTCANVAVATRYVPVN
eukprot:Awhi_evm1s8942